MRRASVARMALAGVLLSVVLIATPANAARGGAKCKIIGATEITEGVTYRCKKSGKTLKWVSTKTKPIPVTISNTRNTSDQVDVVTGFQVKPIYVVPADGVDNSYDTNGYIAGILDEGTKYLREQLGLQIPIDRSAVGYDIQYLKSTFTTAYLQATGSQIDELLTESMVLEDPGPNRKSYVFFIGVDPLRGGVSCGYSLTPGIAAVVAVGKRVDATGFTCTAKLRNFKVFAIASWVHELFHNFGVGHSLDTPCDLMAASVPCPADQNITIDRDRTRYVGSALQGPDILRLRVWEGQTDNLDLEANCALNPVPRTDGFQYAYCPTGTQTIGGFKICYSRINSVTLEEFIDGQWTSLGSGSHSSNHWGPNISRGCSAGFTAPSKQLTVTTPGTSMYRWMVDGKESEQFKVIWVR